jgi:short-subunit dehydrogenase
MRTEFKNRVAVVTGASSGIGWSLAETLAREGARVGLIARREDQLQLLVEQIHKAGGLAAAARADVGDRSQCLSAFQAIRQQLGPVDLLIANAGVGIPTLLEPVNIADVEKTIRVNLLGVIYAIDAVLPEMLERRQGHLAAISSLAAYKGLPGESAYCASKAAVNTYMEGLRIQLAGRNIAVTTVCPGFIRTPMTAVNSFPMPWLLEAGDAARRIVRAIRARRKVYNFPWQTALLMKVTRWLPDWAVARNMSAYNELPPMPPESSGAAPGKAGAKEAPIAE